MVTRNTIQRELVLEAVRGLKNHPTAEEIYSFVVQKYKRISKATVYSNLRVLSDLGEIKKIEIPNQATKYDHISHNHYHFRCKTCGTLFDSDIPYDDKLIQGFQQRNGFVVEDFNLILNGFCPDCINKTKKGEQK